MCLRDFNFLIGDLRKLTQQVGGEIWIGYLLSIYGQIGPNQSNTWDLMASVI